LPPIALDDSHWSNGAWTTPGQKGDADGTRMKMWTDDFAGTQKAVKALQALGLDTFLGMDSNTPAAHLPKFTDDQTFVYNTQGLDKLIYIPGGSYEVQIGKAASVPIHSDHNLIVAPVTLLLDGLEVLTFRFGTCNVRHNMNADLKHADMVTVSGLCDAVMWQEIDTPAANALIDAVFPVAEWHHLFPTYECDMSIRKSMFKLTPKHLWPETLEHGSGAPFISHGVAHVSPNRYDPWAIVTPIPQPTN
jgi:hypothetical protein